MRDAYSLPDFFAALDAWERHKKQYLDAMAKAKQPPPTDESLVGYRNVWLEGFLEAKASYGEQAG